MTALMPRLFADLIEWRATVPRCVRSASWAAGVTPSTCCVPVLGADSQNDVQIRVDHVSCSERRGAVGLPSGAQENKMRTVCVNGILGVTVSLAEHAAASPSGRPDRMPGAEE